MKIKKVLALVCCAAVLMSLAACKPEEAPETTQPATEPSTQPTTVPVTTVPPETTLPPQTTQATEPKVGWVEENGKRYYYDSNSVMLTGWLGLEENWYYLKDDGSMAVGKTEVDGETLYFGPDGLQVLLVNPWNFLPEDYNPEIVDIEGWWRQSNAICYQPLMDMLQGCRDAGLTPYIASAYRTHGDQIYLYNRKIQRLIAEGYSESEARALAGTVVAVPGTSEHELGLAFDLVDDSYRELDEAQENTAVQKWLMENSWRYGFILRYPNSKSEVTGIIYEPWHYRYVGQEMAKAIYESGLCLEEYLDSLGKD